VTLSLDNRVFVPVENTGNGIVSGHTRFYFWQEGEAFYADYFGGDVREGHIIGHITKDTPGDMTGEMLYHCITTDRRLKAGRAHVIFMLIDDIRLAMDIDWEWIAGFETDLKTSLGTMGNTPQNKGRSRYEEVL